LCVISHAWNGVRAEGEIIEMARQGYEVAIMTQINAKYVTRFKNCGFKIIAT